MGGYGPVVIGAAVLLAALLAVAALRLAQILHDIREQQRRILAQLELQTRILHNAARLVDELTDDQPG